MITALPLLLASLAQAAPAPEAPVRTMEFAMERSEAALAAGHYGELAVHSTIGEGGTLDDLRIARSSGSSLLDGEALEQLDGGSIRGSQTGDLVEITIDYLPFTPEGIKTYSCGQATRDLDWWQSSAPGNTPTNSSIYNMLSGLLLIATIDELTPQQSANRYKAFRANFGTAIDRCRDRPDDSFLMTAVKAD